MYYIRAPKIFPDECADCKFVLFNLVPLVFNLSCVPSGLVVREAVFKLPLALTAENPGAEVNGCSELDNPLLLNNCLAINSFSNRFCTRFIWIFLAM